MSVASWLQPRLWAAGFLLGALLTHAPAVAQSSGIRTAPDLVWPVPPDRPRIRYLGELRGAADITPTFKPGRMARMAGLQKRQFLPSFSKPHGIATDSRHRIYVTDSILHMIFVFDRENRRVSYLGGDSRVRLRMPLGIAIDSKDRIWVADGAGQHVLAFDADWNLRGVLGKPGEMENPTSVAVDVARNRLYVADSKKHSVLVYDTESGLYVTRFGGRGSGKGQLNFPTNVALDGSGRIYVADTLNRRIQIFGADLKFLDSFGEQGLSWGQFRKPKGIALDTFQNVYVVDSDFGNFQIFDLRKQLLLFVGELGSDPGQFLVPASIHIDGDNTIYVSDQGNRRVQMFRLLDGGPEDVQNKQVAPPTSTSNK